jgi:F-type H+-transporting ATPase subunit a
MASPALHIKDSYYFEVPKFLWPADYDSVSAFPDYLVRVDPEFLDWQAKRLWEQADELGLDLPEFEDLQHEYHEWLHADHLNTGKSLAVYLEDSGQLEGKLQDKSWVRSWEAAQAEAGDVTAFREANTWSVEKIEGYNHALSGKIVIPQPFGELKNLYEPASGFCISKFMIVQVVVALLVAWLFISLAGHLRNSGAPRGRLTNMLEAILLFFRDEVARKAIGQKEGDKYVPLLWTIFLFVLGCNLMGMVPWVGAPTASFAVTLGLAAVILLTGIVMGSKKFGVVGYWLNQVPSMDLPIYMAVVLKPVLWVIEVAGLLIKHGVLAVRLLANMVAGHIVLLGIMMLAFSVEGAMSPSWWVAAPIALIGSTLFSCLELFVAFLQAYIFTFLSALFIGAAVHHH